MQLGARAACDMLELSCELLMRAGDDQDGSMYMRSKHNNKKLRDTHFVHRERKKQLHFYRSALRVN